MRRITITLALFAACLFAPAAAQAAFGLHDLDVTFTAEDGSPAMQAGQHPYEMTTDVGVNSAEDELLKEVLPEEDVRNLKIDFPPGLVVDRKATTYCPLATFLHPPSGGGAPCPGSSRLGAAESEILGGGNSTTSRLYNLVPPHGVVARIGFSVLEQAPVMIELGLEQTPPYNGFARVVGVPQVVPFLSSSVRVWGTPAASGHDSDRGVPFDGTDRPFLTVPGSCTGPMPTHFEATSWPGSFFEETILSHGEAGEPLGITGCGKLAFTPSITAQPTTKAAESPTGLDFSLDINDEGILNSTGIAQSEIRKTVVTLPEGITTNPSLAEGLEVCSEADLAAETIDAAPGEGCPSASKIGSVELESPLLEGELLRGSLFIAKPYENPFGTLLAMYLTVKDPGLGIMVKQPLKIESDPVTGQLTTIADEMPQLPFSHFRLHFREGTRSPLASPSGCGTYQAKAMLYPWSGAEPITTTSAFEIIVGPESRPCPSGGLPPFKPGLIAGSINNAAGRFSPFNIRLFRNDSEQEITHFSIKLPPGITAKLTGVPYCSDAQIAAAKARTGPHGGAEELASPSCPAASEIGRTLVGGGVGSALAYAPGKVYLAGPYNGSNLSIVAITAGIVGPFDIGTVVVREALKIDPETAEAFIDATGSDPIPHIIKGVPVHLRDIRVYTDRPNFVLNPTDCTRTSTASTVLGSGLDFGSEADDRPITVSTPYQAADCAALPFKPKLGLKLIGGTKRGAHPAFKATLRMNGIGEAGIARAEVTLPKSEFIENAHFNTICTRVQFKAGAGNGASCPAGSIYGKARAITPILGEPLTGPVFLRSSEHQLPDLVVALANKQVDFNLVGHVDSVKGRLRNTFEAAPDAPVSSFVLEMQGGKKGLFVNSTNLCKGAHKAESNFTGQNGKVWNTKPELKVKCKGKGKAKKGKGKAKKHRAH